MQAVPEEPSAPSALERLEAAVAHVVALRLRLDALVRQSTATAQAYLAALELRNGAVQNLHSNLEKTNTPDQFRENDNRILDAQRQQVFLCTAAAADLHAAHAPVFADTLAAEDDFDTARVAAAADVHAAIDLALVPFDDPQRLSRMHINLAAAVDPNAMLRLNRLLRQIHFREAFAPRSRTIDRPPSASSYRCTRSCASDWSSVYRGTDVCVTNHPAYRDLADAAQSLARLLLARAYISAPAAPFHMRAPFDRHMHPDPRDRLKRNNPRLCALSSRVAHIAALSSDDDTCAVAALRALVEFPQHAALVLACSRHVAPEMSLFRDLRLCALRCLAHSADLAAVAPDAVSSTASLPLFVQ